jgi:hypothetical protein
MCEGRFGTNFDMRSKQPAEVFVTKVAAAQRQLDAAIRMKFSDEDDLAVHTLAAAAYRIIRDLRDHRGRPEIQKEALAIGLFFVAKAVAEDRAQELPPPIQEMVKGDPQIQKFAQWVLDTKKGIGRDLSIDDLQLDVTGSPARQWRALSISANFLKHADRDPKSSLSLSRLNTTELIQSAITSYVRLTKQVTSEMRIFLVYSSVEFAELDGDDKMDRWMSCLLRATEPEKRRNVCLQLLAALRG